MTLYVCTKTVNISSRGPPNLSNFLFERQSQRQNNMRVIVLTHDFRQSLLLNIGCLASNETNTDVPIHVHLKNLF